VLWLLLRYDARLVPAYLATGGVLGTVARAAQDGTSAAYAAAAVGVLTTVAMAWLCMRYIDAPLRADAAPATAPATASSPNTA